MTGHKQYVLMVIDVGNFVSLRWRGQNNLTASRRNAFVDVGYKTDIKY